MSLPKDKSPAAEPPQPPTKASKPPIKKGESKILNVTFDKIEKCSYNKCPITDNKILFGMHCVFFENKTYHASCAKQIPIEFQIQQPARRAKEAKNN